ncbi:MAG: hypothetical protein H0V89_08370, partial [Deltaproteobacteria bacterium]|nr:hypothetical protein [Deltaproteobacteria bacterium]
MTRRLGPLSWLVADGLLLAAQAAVVTSALSDPMKVALVAVLQIAKIPATLARLRDLGRPSDDALWTVVPIANALMFFICLQRTPSEPLRARAMATWEGQLSALGALGAAVPLMARTAAVGLPLALAFAVIGGLVGRWVVWQLGTIENMDPAARDTLTTTLWGILAFLGLYTGIQLTKTATASRLSWLPSLFFAPLLIVALVVTFVEQAKLGMGLALMVFLQQAWTMWWMSFGGAATAIGWVRSADHVAAGRDLPTGDVYAEVARRTLEVAGPHGARVQGVAIGMQVVVPGILYWLQLAFTDMIAVLDPEKGALSGSGKLTYGMRGRLFKLLLATSVVGLGGSALIAVSMGTPG